MSKYALANFIIACLIMVSCNNIKEKDSILRVNKSYENEPAWVKKAFNTLAKHSDNMLIDVLKEKKNPRSSERGLKPASDWTSGFFPGVLWYLYDYSDNEYWSTNAQTVTSFLEQEQYNTKDHDIGFRIYCSYGNGYLLNKNRTEYRKVIIRAAESLSSRFNNKTQTIMSWNSNTKRNWKYPVIIDNMMNLELLFEASKLSGNTKFAEISIKHARQTMKYQYREDYSCSHVVDYDPETGQYIRKDWNNGFCDPKIAAWSRGQGWSIYGFTLMYRETQNKEYLYFAEHIAEYIINNKNMPEDMIPYWDYNSPKIPSMRDASAAAITASALLELSTYSVNRDIYFNAAEKILKSLSSTNYLAKPASKGNFAIMHTTGNFLAASELDGGISYADYYFIEALSRYLKLINKQNIFLS